MLDSVWNNFLWLIGGNTEKFESLSIYQVIFRTVIIYCVALLIIRIAKRRFMGGYSTFDILIGFVVGSIMAKAIIGDVSLVSMAVILAVLAILHWVIAWVSFKSDEGGDVLKNTNRKLIIDGEIQRDALEKSKIGERDLLQAVRSQANLESAEQVKVAYLERGGSITVIPATPEPSIVETAVEDGVQTIKIVIENKAK